MGHSITVIGTGYVGLVSGACLARLGHDVVCLDVDRERIDALQAGHIPMFEPGLDELVTSGLASGTLRFTTDVVTATEHGDFQMIAVGTPEAEDGSANVSYVYTAARNIGRFITRDTTLIVKSTVPVGTGERVLDLVSAEVTSRGEDYAVTVVSNPEFLREGQAVADFMNPDRVVMGSHDVVGIDAVRKLYAALPEIDDRTITTSLRTSELIKYAANAMLATRISFMNELARLADKLGADIDDVKAGIGSDPRIGPQFLNAGTGYGGSCFPKDVQALIHTARDQGLTGLQILEAVEEVNQEQKMYLVDKLEEAYSDVADMTVAVWGLAFKPQTDDVREATSVSVISYLTNLGAQVRAYDPVSTGAFEASARLPGVTYASSAEGALEGADVLLILTEWSEFGGVSPDMFARHLRRRAVFDGRNIYRPGTFAGTGVAYHSIGRPSVLPE